MDEDLELRLSHDEALVLFEFLTRFSQDKRLVLEDQAEERVLLAFNASSKSNSWILFSPTTPNGWRTPEIAFGIVSFYSPCTRPTSPTEKSVPSLIVIQRKGKL